MTESFQAESKRSNRAPYAGALAFFLILIVVGIMFLIPKLRHRDTLEAEARAASGPPTVLVTTLKQGEIGGHIELPATVQPFDQTPNEFCIASMLSLPSFCMSSKFLTI